MKTRANGLPKGEPIAIVGIGCRFPGGANDAEGFWELLRMGVDAVTNVPNDRWRAPIISNGKEDLALARGGFIHGWEEFDAEFFGISPREAALMDPQQRLLLEVAWEALEDAGIVPEDVAGSKAAVFIGISTQDYGMLEASVPDLLSIGAYTNSGVGFCIAANRISYFFDFRGPSVALDTACSSSLVAIHLACQSIWNEDCSLALAGGVNALLRVESSIGFHRSMMLSPSGCCKSFDAEANGYTRSEGAGIVVLKRLSRALAAGDPIYATIRSTAINQSGRGPGLTVPNTRAQERLLRDAYRQARVPLGHVEYIEAHGTGTRVGDPIEALAIGKALGRAHRRIKHCIIGSVKSNIGHLEAAAGIAGFVKASLCLKKGAIPPSLHFRAHSPNVDFERLRLRVPQTLEEWPKAGNRRRIAGVNSFGFGGVNAHVVLEEAPQASSPPSNTTAGALEHCLFALSARTPEALLASAESFLKVCSVAEEEIHLSDLCFSVTVRRAHHDNRLAIVTATKAELAEKLKLFATGEPRVNLSSGRKVNPNPPKIAFVFGGIGAQWPGMGVGLLKEPEFRNTIEKCEGLLRKHVSWSLIEELSRPRALSRINETRMSQPAIFCLQIAFAALWRSWGIVPDLIVGHSVGEVAAACVSGALPLNQAIAVIFHRSRLQHRMEGHGKLLAAAIPLKKAEDLIVNRGEELSIAAINSPCSVTLSGAADKLEQIRRSLDNEGVFCRFLATTVPYHSPKMDPLMRELRQVLKRLRPRTATTKLLSTVTGRSVSGVELDGSYWAENIRKPVRFEEAMICLIKEGCELFIEIGPHPVLTNSISECFATSRSRATILPSLKRDDQDRKTILSSLGELYTRGFPVAWKKLYKSGKFVRLPHYPWQKERYWFESDQSKRNRVERHAHPILGTRLKTATPIWSVEIDQKHSHSYLSDHRIQGAIVFPGAAYVEMALAAAKETFGSAFYVLEEVEFLKLCLLPENSGLKFQLVLDPTAASFDIHSLAEQPTSAWTRHATGKLSRIRVNHEIPRCDLDRIRATCPIEIHKEEYYTRCQTAGLNYGDCFKRLDHIWCGDGQALGRVVPLVNDAGGNGYLVHPAVLDSCFQAVLATMPKDSEDHESFDFQGLPVGIDRLCFYKSPSSICWVHVRFVSRSERSLKADLTLMDESGEACMTINELCCQSLTGALTNWSKSLHDKVYVSRWEVKNRATVSEFQRSREALSPPLQIIERVKMESVSVLRDLANARRDKTLEPLLRNWSCMYFLRALDLLGWDFRSRPRFSFGELTTELKIISEHHRFLHRMLEMLVETEILIFGDDVWEVRDLPDYHNISEVEQRSWLKLSAYLAECVMLKRCGERLPQIMRGEIDPLAVIFPEGSIAQAQHLYQDSPTYRPYNLLVGRAVRAALSGVCPGRVVRILELGGGTGGMTSYILPLLTPERTEYVFTDISAVFVAHAKQTFSDKPFLQYKTLDIEVDPAAQGFQPHSFDLIVASDVLHTTRDLRKSLENVKWLLASRGLLIMLEGTSLTYLTIMVFGLLKSWWHFSDERINASDPRIPLEAWHRLLIETGFQESASIPETAEVYEAAHSVIVAQGPAQTEVELPSTSAPTWDIAGPWIIACDEKGLGLKLAGYLQQYGASSFLVYPGAAFQKIGSAEFQVRPTDSGDWRQVIENTPIGSSRVRGVVHLWSLDVPSDQEMTLTGLTDVNRTGFLSVSTLIQALESLTSIQAPKFWLVTRGAQPALREEPLISVAQSPLWGLGRVIMNEHPALGCTLVDLDPGSTEGDVRHLIEETCCPDQESEISFRGDVRYVHRLEHAAIGDLGRQSKSSDQHPGERIEITLPSLGILESVCLRKVARQKPKPWEVEIEVRASGLNFKDLMIAMGTLPVEAFEAGYTGSRLGIECSGIVTAVGSEIDYLAPGDEVLACAPATLGTHTTVDARFVLRKPPELTFEEAATIPVAFSTAYYALHVLGCLRKGDRILIHAAAGGVGLAALQLAQAMGSEVYATAGSVEKRDFLKAIGVRFVSDSRSLEFADDIMQWTNGRGVDLVINSLAGEAISKSISILAPYGRFIEIGKYDIYANTKIGLRPFRSNLSFFSVDVDRLMRERPDTAAAIPREVFKLFAIGAIFPLPHRVFPVSRIAEAFRYMAQAKHIGKIIVSLEDISDIEPASQNELKPCLSFPEDSTYLVTGGLRGFGLATAQWLVKKGARHLVLIARTDPSSPETTEAVKKMRSCGAEVRIAVADVSDENAVRAILHGIENSMPRLRGIFHAAMVLDDTILAAMDEGRLTRVMAPKVAGAWNLHVLTSQIQLDYFVLYSSVSSLFGTPAQSNYAAANSFLDSLAWHRRMAGLPATAVNWGVIADVGHVARHPELARVLESQLGSKGSSAEEMLAILDCLLQVSAIQASVVKLDWQHTASAMQTIRVTPRFTNVLKESGRNISTETRRSIISVLRAVSPAERFELVDAHVRREIALIMGTSAEKLDLDKPMINLGIDSLMAIELKNRVERDFGIELTTTQFLAGLNLRGMIQMLYDQAMTLAGPDAKSGSPGETDGKQPAVDSSVAHERSSERPYSNVLLASVDELSDEEVDRMLRAAVKGEG